jgi:hypothetical protein
MTEAEWLACTDPKSLLHHLGSKADKRKCMLFVCACERRLWNEPGCAREKITVTERYADGEATAADVAAALQQAPWLFDLDVAYVTACVGEVRWAIAESLDSAAFVADAALRDRALKEGRQFDRFEVQSARKAGYDAEKGAQSNLLRDIFGNPFRLVLADPAWFTTTLQNRAAAIYEERAFDRLPILADALEEAGCRNAEILAHCRGPGPHVLGCWCLDLLLGKT